MHEVKPLWSQFPNVDQIRQQSSCASCELCSHRRRHQVNDPRIGSGRVGSPVKTVDPIRALVAGNSKGAITSKIKHAIKLKTSHARRCAVISCKLKQNANEGCNSCASLQDLF